MRKRYTPEAYAKKENAVNVMDKNALISEILNERARELAFEDIVGLIFVVLHVLGW